MENISITTSYKLRTNDTFISILGIDRILGGGETPGGPPDGLPDHLSPGSYNGTPCHLNNISTLHPAFKASHPQQSQQQVEHSHVDPSTLDLPEGKYMVTSKMNITATMIDLK